MEEGQDAAIVYMITRGQIVTAEEGRTFDLSIPAIKIVMDLFGIHDQKKCLMQVLKIFHYFQGKRNE